MADMFSTYEEEFLGIKKMIQDLVESIPSATGETRSREVADADDLVEQAKDLVTKHHTPIHHYTDH